MSEILTPNLPSSVFREHALSQRRWRRSWVWCAGKLLKDGSRAVSGLCASGKATLLLLNYVQASLACAKIYQRDAFLP